MRKLMLAAAAAWMVAAPASAETLTNATVVTLVHAGVGDEAIVAKVKSSDVAFDLSTAQIIELKRQGVSGAVIAAMLGAGSGATASARAAMSAESPDWKVPHPSGVYLLSGAASAARMVRIDATTANQTKTGGMLGYALTAGIVPIKMKSVIPNARARVSADAAKPEFYFFFDESNASLSTGGNTGSWLTGSTASVTSPSEFSLVRFDVKDDRREARVGSFNIGGAKSGVMDKDRIPFAYDRLAPGVFRVVPEGELKAGEYGFLYSMAAGNGPGVFGGGVMTARVFDFSVGTKAAR